MSGEDDRGASKVPAVAILPFANLGEKPGEDYFANGITVSLITDLAKYPDLRVIAPGSVLPYRDGSPGALQVSRELKTDFVVRGSVQRRDGRVRIDAQLIEAARHALTLSPNYADAYALLAWALNFSGNTAEALPALEMASRLNPIVPAAYSEILGEIRFVQGDYVSARRELNRALFINPTHMRARMWLIATLASLDEDSEMNWQVDELTAMNPEFSREMLDYTFPFRDQSLRARILLALERSGLPR